MGKLDDKYIQEALRTCGLGAAERPQQHKRASAPRRVSRTLLAAAITVSLFAALCAGAYAMNLFGIAELWKSTHTDGSSLPEQAVDIIEPHTEASAEAEDFGARITETLCTDRKLLCTVVVTGGDKYLVAPTDACEEDPVEMFGLEGTGTLGEYAAARGKKLLFVSASPDYEQLAVSTAGMTSTYTGENELTILINAEKNEVFSTIDTQMQISACESGSNDVQRLYVPVTLHQGETTLIGTYVPADPDAVPGFHVGELQVTQTSLGYDFVFLTEPENMDASMELMRIEFYGLENKGNICGPDENGLTTLSMMTGTVGDTLKAHFDNWDKQLIGEIEFLKK